jgi:vacuolar-type H+-ATPase subunit H
MSLESLIELVLSEAKVKADAITDEAQKKADESHAIASDKAQALYDKIISDYTKQASRIAQQAKSQAEMAEKSATLSAINEALDKLATDTAKTIATSKEGQEKIIAWIAGKKGSSFSIGKDLASAMPNLEMESSKFGKVSVDLIGFEIQAKAEKFVDVLDLKDLARRCISDNASDIVAKLTAP